MQTSSLVFRIRVLVLSLVALAALSTVQRSAVADESLSRQTDAGHEVLIRGFAEFDGDCRGRAAERIRIVDAPSRGRIEQRLGKLTLDPARVDGRSCAAATLDAVLVYYVPDDGFVGRDRFAFDVDYPSRKSLHAKVDVAVDGTAGRW